jgi:hypothetical protein
MFYSRKIKGLRRTWQINDILNALPVHAWEHMNAPMQTFGLEKNIHLSPSKEQLAPSLPCLTARCRSDSAQVFECISLGI